MEEVVILYDAVFMSFLESFSPEIDEAFSLLENQVALPHNSSQQMDDFLQTLLTDFPRLDSRYKEIISTLTTFASSNPVSILTSLCARFKNELKRSSDQPPATLIITSLSFKPTNFHHFQFHRYLTMIIISDLIYSIYKEFPSKDPVPTMVSCGSTLCMAQEKLRPLQMQLINKWADIFHLISFQTLDEISKNFERHSDDDSTANIYYLDSRVVPTSDFIHYVLSSFQQNKKHKTISSEMMSALSTLLASAKCEESVLEDFYQIAWNAKKTSSLKDGAIDLICVLLNRIQAPQKKLSQFYSKRVFKHSGDASKLERSARAFLTLIRGDISKVNQDEDPHYFQTVGNNISQDSFSSIFMKSFFENSNFKICPTVFGEILAHLASIDIKEFEKVVLYPFLSLNADDSRIVSLLNAIEIINSDSFIKYSICMAKQESITNINRIILPVLLNFLKSNKNLGSDKHLILTRDILQLQSTIDECDNIVIDFLTQNDFLIFDAANSNTRYKPIDRNRALPLLSAIRVIPYAISKHTIDTTNIVELIIRFMCNGNFIISSAANDIYKKLLENSDNKLQKKFAKKCISILLKSSDEITAKCLSLLLDMITNLKFSKSFYADLEAAVFCCFIKENPFCRTLALSILKHLSATNMGLIYKILHDKTAAISETINRSINVLNIPEKPSMNRPPLGYIDFEHACCSRYNDLWLIFLSEIFSTLIDCECADFLQKCRTLIRPLVNSTIQASISSPACQKSSSMSAHISVSSMTSTNDSNSSEIQATAQSDMLDAFIPKSSSMLVSNDKASSSKRSESNPTKTSNCPSTSKQERLSSLSPFKMSSFTITAVNILYIDSFAFEIDNNNNNENIQIPVNDMLMPEPEQTKSNENNKTKKEKDKEKEKEKEREKDKEKRKHHKHRSKSLNAPPPSLIDNDATGAGVETDTTDTENDNENENNEDLQPLRVESLFHTILTHSDYKLKKNLVHTFCYLNWRLIPSVLPYILSIDDYLSPEAAAALSFVIQSPENFNHIISSIFRNFINFLSLLQGYFIQLGINSTRKIIWDQEHLSLLEEHKGLCVNYCILISAAFNNIPGQISEEDFPLPNRQVLVQFLTHWAELPPEFEQVRSYAINALIPIIHAGTVFTDGFIFELPMLEMLTQCQMNGYPVLDSLLLFHLDVLLDEFVKSAFLRPKREAQLFLEAIISALEYCEDSSSLQNHVGSLILLAMFYAQDQEMAAERIMLKIASLFLDKSRDTITNNNSATNNNNSPITLKSTKPASFSKNKKKKGSELSQKIDFVSINNSNHNDEPSKSILAHTSSEDSETKESDNDETDSENEEDEEDEEEEEHEDMSPDNIVSKYQFATEQVIDAGFEILRISTKITVSKSVVTILSYFFEKVRILPTHSFIVQGIPSKFRKFTIMSFFDTMYSVSSSLKDEFLDVFSTLWQNLLQNSDNNVVILLCLFESEKSEIKEKIFTHLLDKDPALISKYLANRCTFAYWYFLRTDRQLNVQSTTWMLRVLTRAFTNFIPDSVPNYTIAFHFSLLFIEEAEDLFEALLGVLNLDSVNSQFIWSIDPSNGSIFAASLVHAIVGIFKEQKQEAIDKWSLEAIRWAVACCDIKIGFRSLVIFNALETILPEQYLHLLIRAVLYHLSRVTEDDCEEVALFVGESFLVFQSQLDKKDVISVAFKFASLFLRCPAFEKNCLKRAMPIFLSCMESAVLKNMAKSILSDAFIPYLRNIENDDEAQKLLKEIITNSDVPELLLVAACFLVEPLPFINVDKNYKDIIIMPMMEHNANKTLELFSVMLKTASPDLTNNIFQVSSAIIKKFENTLDSSFILPIYNVAVQKVAQMKSAVLLITSLMKFYPGIGSLSKNDYEEKRYIDDIRQGLNRLIQDVSYESVPITNCEQINQLCGMIDQKNPPKILPYSSQYEMLIGLRKNPTIEKKKLLKKWSSTMSLNSGILSNRSFILPALDGNDFSKIEFAELPKSQINKKFLDIPSDDNGSWRFVVPAKEFLELAE